MAEAMLISALQKLVVVATKKGVELYEVHNQIQPMHRNLEMIQAFLRNADSNQHKNERVKVWVNQVRELAYRVGGAMDTFMVEIEKNPKSSGVLRRIKRVFQHPIKLNTLSAEFKSIGEEMKRIFETRTLLGIELGSASEQPSFHELPFRPSRPIDIDDSEVVGFDVDKGKIISHLLDESIPRRTVLSIVGIGGLGKTTLAQKIYKSAELSMEFSCRAWVSISQKFDANKVCREILYSLDHKMKEKNISDEEVWEELKKSLSEKRYLIILDDVWTTDLWEQLRIVIPDTNNASRVVITTRILDVALAADRKTEPYKLDYLNEDESLTLLFRKAQQDVQAYNKYPSHLVEVAKKLIERCGRLPLALVVLGGLLSTKPDTYVAWKKVYDTLNWHNEQGKKCAQILRMSYQELCYEQKQRFLYFVAFPEDHKISVEHITRLWIAEGLIPVDGEGTMEDRAEDYLEELVNRSLVQVIKKSWTGFTKYCGIHDLLRDLAIHEAKEENFFSVFSKHEDASLQLATKETQRVALQFQIPRGYYIHPTNIRSLLCFEGIVPNFHLFTQLRVLVVEGIKFYDIIKISENCSEGLVHVRYLGLRSIYRFEMCDHLSLSSMKNLETLEFDVGFQTKVDILSLLEVSTLRHIKIKGSDEMPFPLKWGNLKNLQTLQTVVLGYVPKLECNINLRTLKITLRHQIEYPEESWKALEALLSRTDRLVSLTIYLDGYIFFKVGDMRKLPCYETIQLLHINGKWLRGCVPTVEMFPKNLTKLSLGYSGFTEDPMPILEGLQFLGILGLYDKAYTGNNLTCSTGGFPSLHTLELLYLSQLREWEIKEGAMPSLSQLKVIGCWKLRTLPELQNVPSLQKLIISESIHTELQSEELYKIKHIPSVLLFKH